MRDRLRQRWPGPAYRLFQDITENHDGEPYGEQIHRVPAPAKKPTQRRAHDGQRSDDQRVTEKDSYRMLLDDYAQLAREQLVFGFHVHVAVPDRELAIQTMNRVRPWLPVLLAMSGSSPFWQGVDTGYASYRTEVFGRWPTTGTPGAFESRAEFDQLVEAMKATGAIDEPARIYWSVRPSAKYPTLEFRVADVCTSIDDAVLIAGLVRALTRTCADDAAGPDAHGSYPAVRPELLRPAVWRAARHGLTEQLVDLNGLRLVPAADAVTGLLEFVKPALAEWGDWPAIETLAADLLDRGTSAERQRSVLRRTGDLRSVVEWLATETAEVPVPPDG